MNPIRILYFAAIWQRQELTRLHFANLRRMIDYKPDRFQITPHFAVSEDWAADLCREHDFSFTHAQNKPIGAKLNAGLKPRILEHFDFLLTMGSDDFVEPTFLDSFLPYFQSLDAFGLNELHVLDALTGKQKRVIIGYCYGALRCIRWKYVQQAALIGEGECQAYRGLWEPMRNQGLDFYSMEALKERTGVSIVPVKIKERLWDVKDGQNINSFRKVGGEEINLPLSEIPQEIRHLAAIK